MNKKVNTVLFMLGATIVTTIITLGIFIIPTVILTLILQEKFADISLIAIPILLLAAMVGSFFIYTLIMKKITAKVDMNKYFEPIFGKKK